jgi:hypothetical protein
MGTDYHITVTNTSEEEGYRIFTLSVTNPSNEFEYKVYVLDRDIPIQDTDLSSKTIEHFVIQEMHKWIKRSGGKLPEFRFVLLMNGGLIPTNNLNEIKAILTSQGKISDLARTNVTIAAPLFEWAKSKAQKEGTSFSDLVSRGLITLRDSDKEIEAWFKEQAAYFRKKLGEYGYYEVIHYLPNNYTEFNTDTLQVALQEAVIRRTGWPIGVYLHGGDNRPHPQEDGIKADYEPKNYLLSDYWYAKTKGEFYFARNLESDSGNGEATPKTCVYFDTLIWRVAEAIEHCIKYYHKLNIKSGERVKIKISLNGINNRTLSAWNPGRSFTLNRYICSAERNSWESENTLKELQSNLDETIYEAVKKLLVLFDFFVPSKEVVFDILNREYRKSNM